jgi:hypothetical protein
VFSCVVEIIGDSLHSQFHFVKLPPGRIQQQTATEKLFRRGMVFTKWQTKIERWRNSILRFVRTYVHAHTSTHNTTNSWTGNSCYVGLETDSCVVAVDALVSKGELDKL